jgi:colicin import membrane protein
MALEIAQHEPFVAAKRASALALVGLSVSALVHGAAIFVLLQLEPAQAVDSGAQEIPVEIVVEASGSEPAAAQVPPPAQVEPAEVEPPPISPLATAENEPPPAPPEIAAADPRLPPAAQAAPSEPEPPPPPGVDPVQPADAAAEPVAPPPEPTAPALSPPPEPIAVPAPIEPARAEPQRPAEPSDDVAERRRQEELQRRARAEAEAKKTEEAAARKQADAKKREEKRAAAQAAMAHDREAALERFVHAAAPSHLAPAPGSDLLDYHSAVLRHLAAFKHYPESARERGAHGQTVVTFTLDNAGRVVSASIARSSGQADIDAETLAMVRRAQPFPTPPPAAQRSFSAAIEFHLE